MRKQKVHKQNNTLAELQMLLIPALARLDLRGTDETVSKALIITNEAFKSLQDNGENSAEKLYSRAMEIYKQQEIPEG